MSNANFDPTAYKNDQRQTWNSLAASWEKWFDAFEAAAHPVTKKLIELAGVGPGHAVLDIGTGTGEPALSAAAAVGSSGRVVAVDQSGEMLAVARRKAGDLAHLTFLESDAEQLSLEPGSFDAILSRWGLMFLPDRERVLRSVHELLDSGGTLAAAVWDVPPKVPMIALAFGVIARTLSLPPPPQDAPNPFNMADTSAVEQQLRAAGFTDITFERVPVSFTTASIDLGVEFLRDLLPPRMKGVLRDRCGSELAPEIWEAVAAELKNLADTDGRVTMTSSSICFKASKPA